MKLHNSFMSISLYCYQVNNNPLILPHKQVSLNLNNLENTEVYFQDLTLKHELVAFHTLQIS